MRKVLVLLATVAGCGLVLGLLCVAGYWVLGPAGFGHAIKPA